MVQINCEIQRDLAALHKNVRYEGYSPAKAQRRKGAKKVQRNAAALCVFAPLRETFSRNSALLCKAEIVLIDWIALDDVHTNQADGDGATDILAAVIEWRCSKIDTPPRA